MGQQIFFKLSNPDFAIQFEAVEYELEFGSLNLEF